MKFATKLLAATAVLGLAATTVQASSYVNVAGVSGDVYALDWNPGNALVKGGIPLATGESLTMYYQAKLGNFNGISGTPITSNGGLNSSYEITLVGGFGETATVYNSGLAASFALDGNSTTNYFQMYYDTANDSNSLTGTGFTNGTLIMSGHVTEAFGSFNINTTSATGALTALDQFGTNNWGDTLTVKGTGGTSLTVTIDSYDASIFSTPFNTLLLDLLFNTSNILPYSQVDPSKQFSDETGTLFDAEVGTINGITGPDMLFQADANSSPVLTPEPSTMVLLGAGLFGLSVFARRRNNK